jgi:hypothetical protein
LSALQVRALTTLAGLRPRWTLTGGGALIGFHLAHRETRDVDLFFHGIATLGRLPEEAAGALRSAGLEVGPLQRTPSFARLRASAGAESVLVDLVAEPVANVFPPEPRQLDGVEILTDPRAEILVNKLAALYSRSEIRDLVDTHALVEAGEDLRAAVALVPRKDAGFSPPGLAWVLRTLNVSALARAEGLDPAPLLAFRDRLVDELLR